MHDAFGAKHGCTLMSVTDDTQERSIPVLVVTAKMYMYILASLDTSGIRSGAPFQNVISVRLFCDELLAFSGPIVSSFIKFIKYARNDTVHQQCIIDYTKLLQIVHIHADES